MHSHPDLLLINAHVLTMDNRRPLAQGVAVRGETIVAVGSTPDILQLKNPQTRVIDCRGLTLLPGFIDAHCHVLALAGSLTGIDCNPKRASSIEDLQRVIKQQAQRTPPGCWLRGYGYEHLAFAEKRYPHRWDLDIVAPHHPVRLDHRSGHCVVLNSRALEMAGIHRDTPDPPEGVIQRDEATGEPTGVLLEMAGFLRDRLGSTRTDAELEAGVKQANQKLLEYGVTSVQDAGPNNDLDRWSTFHSLIHSGNLQPHLTMMAGVSYLDEFAGAGMSWGAGDDRLRLGHAKIMLTLTTGSGQPDVPELQEQVKAAHQQGFPVAIHAVESEAVAAAAQALKDASGPARAQEKAPWSGLTADRIEHCSECPPEVLAQVQESGATVVTQPGFVYWNGDSYLERVAPELLPHLYAIGALARAGISMGFGSDAPVVDPNPWPAIHAAVTRATRKDNYLPRGEKERMVQRVSVLDALRAYTNGGAWSEGTQARKASISAGKLADLVLLDADPTGIDPAEIRNIRAVLTVIGGRVVWERGR